MVTQADKRTRPRMPTRLRPAKLLSGNAAFLGDCAILDRSASGVRVGIFDATPLAGDMLLFDETELLRWSVRLVWQNGAFAGLRFEGEGAEVDRREADRLAGRYYALG